MFGREALTNLKHLISPKLRYMGMEGVDSGPQDNVKHLPVTDSQPQVSQTMCHRRSKAGPLIQTSIQVTLSWSEITPASHLCPSIKQTIM